MTPTRWRRAAEYGLSFALFLGIWKGYVAAYDVPAFILPSPEETFLCLVRLFKGEIYFHLAVTTGEIVSGFLLGSVLGFLFGYPLARSALLRKALMPYVLFAQTAPKIALIPLFVLWFGLGWASKLILIVSMVFFPVMASVILGMQSVDRGMRDLMHVLRASRLQTFWEVELPSSLPPIFAGLKVGIVQAVIGAIVAEWISSKSGLGYLLTYASALSDTPLLVAAIIVTSSLGVLLYEVLDVVEGRLLGWHESKRDTHAVLREAAP